MALGDGQGGGPSVEVSSGLFSPRACSGPQEGIQGLKEAADCSAGGSRAQTCTARTGVWGLHFRGMSARFYCFPHTAPIPDNLSPVFGKGDGWDLPSSPVVKTLTPITGCVDSTSDWGTRSCKLHGTAKEKERNRNFSSPVVKTSLPVQRVRVRSLVGS